MLVYLCWFCIVAGCTFVAHVCPAKQLCRFKENQLINVVTYPFAVWRRYFVA